MKIFIFSFDTNEARREAEKIARERGGKVHYDSGVWIVEIKNHASREESGSELTDLKDMSSPLPGLKNTVEAIE